MQQKLLRSAGLAFALHLAILAFFFYRLPYHSQPSIQNRSVISVVLSPSMSSAKYAHSLHSTHQVKKTQRHATSTHQAASTGNHQTLLALLHARLAAEAVYPASAQAFHREGVVLLGFMLTPEGIISHPRVVKTSGASVLDDAALALVVGLAEVPQVENHLKHPEYFTVSVAYQSVL